MIYLKISGLPDYFLGGILEYVFIIYFLKKGKKNQATAVSHQAITLRMKSNNCRLTLLINARLPREEASINLITENLKI